MKLFRLLQTTRHFKPAQIRHKILYELKKAKAENGKFRLATSNDYLVQPFEVQSRASLKPAYQDGVFTFLNKSKHFGHLPDWNFYDFGKHWNICLNSFDYMEQPSLDPDLGLKWIHNFILNFPKIRHGFDSYCVSRRLIHWLPFISKNRLS